jgi:hypothetical protein
VTDKAGVKGNGDWGMGGCVGDVDNNGYDDLFITNYGRDVLYLNNGNGTFRDVSASAGIEGGQRFHSGCAFGDYDGDGDLDLYVSTYAEFDLAIARTEPPYTTTAVPGKPLPLPPGPERYKASTHEFYENIGNGRFIDVSEKSGVAYGAHMRARTTGVAGHGFGVVWGDYDNDGRPDIYVANDITPNFLFHNNGDKTFTEVGGRLGVATDLNGRAQAGMGVDMADFDNDERLDFVVTNYADDHTTLYLNSGRGPFSDVSKTVGLLVGPFLSWGTQFADFNLDGLLDLLIVNGHVSPLASDASRRPGSSYAQRALLYEHQEDGTLREIGTTLEGFFTEKHVSRGLAVGDLNNDGHLDFVVQNQDESPSVVINRGVPGNWTLIKLRGTKSNRSAIGARVTIRAGGRTQMREVKSGGSFLSQSDLRLHFGLRDATVIDQLTVRWPSGRVQVERGLKTNRIVSLTEK